MQPSPDDVGIFQPRALRSSKANDDDGSPSKGRRHRSHKQRSSGAFLLSDSLHDNSTQDLRRPHPDRRSRNVSDSYGKGLASQAAERPHSSGEYPNSDSPRSSVAPLDLDSTQIVNMALNLSETRRLASRRTVSQHISPRLAQLPDSIAGGGLRQHLQQQRRMSGRVSPKPRALSRGGTGSQKLNSPLQSSFDPVHDGSYRYHFSKSTLSRAQKAKDYLELLAQHRRLLDFVPPLTLDQAGRSSIASRPTTPNGLVKLSNSASPNVGGTLGRPYNPLQYVRNRKVRARERQAIDSEAQGFNDVLRVTEWVDEVVKLGTSRSNSLPWDGLPSFPLANEEATDANPPSNATRAISNPSKPKRPRVDWVIDPADMVADLYWLEQGDHKMLVEDRHWRRVFPQDPELYRPWSRQTNDSSPPVNPQAGPVPELSTTTTKTDSTVSKPVKGEREHEHEHVFSSARERAHQKLQALKGLQHHHRRHGSSIHKSDSLRDRRGSLSDASVTDDSIRRRHRSGTLGRSDLDVLEKQMRDMIAQEQRDEELDARRDPPAVQHPSSPNGTRTPEAERLVASTAPSRTPSHKRETSITEPTEAERKYRKLKPRPASPQRPGRDSLEVPQSGRRHSIDYDTSVPNSPDLRPTRSSPFVPAIGMDLSPSSSRPSSPSRKPISNLKRIFRDRSRERAADFPLGDKGGSSEPVLATREATQEPSSAERTRKASPQRRGSGSPMSKIASRETDSSHKSHRSIGSIKLRGDDSSSGLRGLLRAPRIDSVLRSGVSRVGDLLWKKEIETSELPSSDTSSSESELEPRRGRSREHEPSSQTPPQEPNEVSGQHSVKTYLDVMPSFVPASEAHGKPGLGEPGSPAPSRPPSRRSTRFDRLKPPKIDVQTPPGHGVRAPNEVDASAAESRRSSFAEGVRAADARLNAALSLTKQQRQFSASAPGTRRWPICDRRESEPSAAALSKSEIARLRTLVLSSGITAMEIDRRANARRLLGADAGSQQQQHPQPVTWATVANLAPDPRSRAELLRRPTAQTEVYPLAARVLASSVGSAGTAWRRDADGFAGSAAPALASRAEELRARARDLSEMTRAAADEADEVGRDLVAGQRLGVKRVVDVIEKLLRRRRRRFRWLRRAGWLALEWALVGFMWYVWFVVVIARVVFGIGKGVLGGVRWLLWL